MLFLQSLSLPVQTITSVIIMSDEQERVGTQIICSFNNNENETEKPFFQTMQKGLI